MLFILPLISKGVELSDIYLLTSPIILISFYQFSSAYNLSYVAYRKIVNYFLVCMFTKYAISKFIFFINRPGLFTENNYELMFITIIAVPNLLRRERIAWFLLTSIIAISGSLSAQLGFLSICLYFLIFNIFNLSRSSRICLLSSTVILAIIALIQKYATFSLEDIDRGRMLLAFLQEFTDRSFINTLFSIPGSFVTESTILSLGSYHKLFSSTDPTRAYSVIFHAGFLRFAYDYGLIGLLVYIQGLAYFMRARIVNQRVIHCVLIVMFTNSLSVSSFYSIYFWVGVMIVSVLRYDIIDQDWIAMKAEKKLSKSARKNNYKRGETLL